MKTKELIYAALFAALIAVLGMIPPIPLGFIPVPITAQTLGVMLAGCFLGKRMGALSLVIFIILVAIGLPVLTGGRGGIAVLIGPSAGYIFSFPIAAGLIGWYSEKSGRRSNLEADSDQRNLWCITSESDWCTSHGINNQYVDLGWTCRSVSLSSGGHHQSRYSSRHNDAAESN